MLWVGSTGTVINGSFGRGSSGTGLLLSQLILGHVVQPDLHDGLLLIRDLTPGRSELTPERLVKVVAILVFLPGLCLDCANLIHSSRDDPCADESEPSHHFTHTTNPSTMRTSAYQRCGSGYCGPSTHAVPFSGSGNISRLSRTCSPRATASLRAFLVG